MGPRHTPSGRPQSQPPVFRLLTSATASPNSTQHQDQTGEILHTPIVGKVAKGRAKVAPPPSYRAAAPGPAHRRSRRIVAGVALGTAAAGAAHGDERHVYAGD